MMSPGFIKLGILIDFKINQDFIAEVLCINKDKPMTLCNGKCYLSQKLKKAEEQEKKQVPSSLKEKSEVLYCYTNPPFDYLKYTDTYLSKLNAAYENEFYHSAFVTDIFRPPKLNLM